MKAHRKDGPWVGRRRPKSAAAICNKGFFFERKPERIVSGERETLGIGMRKGGREDSVGV